MAVWTEVEGCVIIRKDSKFSFKKYIMDNFAEAEPRITQEEAKHPHHHNTVRFWFNFSESNMLAAKKLQELVDTIKHHDKQAVVDISSNLRFIG